MVEAVSREIRLRNIPVGMPSHTDFELVEVPTPKPGWGEILVRNLYLSVDPYMRMTLLQPGEPLEGSCVGQVVESRGNWFQIGDYVWGMLGWRDYNLSDGAGLLSIDPNIAPIQSYLGLLGMPGLTAYVGLLDIGQPIKGNTVFVSSAGGAVGGIACQIAKIMGCRVVGSTGSEKKEAWLISEAGIDAAFNYKGVPSLNAELRRYCPSGIDVYFDNVGGKHLEAALEHMNLFGRIVLCGMISEYNVTEPTTGPSNLGLAAISKRLTLKGFLVSDYSGWIPQFYGHVFHWLAEGRIKVKETIVEGIENAPKALIGLFNGENLGKMLVKTGPNSAEY